MSKHHPDLLMCRRQPGITAGRLCDKCDGRCVICDSYVRPRSVVRICDECAGVAGGAANKCIVCGGLGVSDAQYCAECCMLERDRDGCPRVVNLGTARTDLYYEKKKYLQSKRQPG